MSSAEQIFAAAEAAAADIAAAVDRDKNLQPLTSSQLLLLMSESAKRGFFKGYEAAALAMREELPRRAALEAVPKDGEA